jgi:hypothetical protein
MVAPITSSVPDPAATQNESERRAFERALEYMDLKAGTLLEDIAASTASSSAPAPTRALKICAPQPASPKAITSAPTSQPWSFPAHKP